MIGVIFSLWIGIGAIIHGKSPVEDNLPVGQCLDNNSTIFNHKVLDEEAIVGSINQTDIIVNEETR